MWTLISKRQSRVVSLPCKHRKIHLRLWTPSGHFLNIHMDFAGPINGLSFLVVVEIFPMKNTDTHSTITILKQLFSQHGLPETLVSGNGIQFTSESFRHFCRSSCITHIRASPTTHNPMVKQNILWIHLNMLHSKQKGREQQREIQQAFLLSYQTTPNDTVKNSMSPAEALMGRKLHTTLHALHPHKQQQRQDTCNNKG